MKSGQKRAVRLLDKREDADLLANVKGGNHYVEHRKGGSIKCMSYCLCKRFCSFYQDFVALESREAEEEQAAA
jgi:hypothetical protein